MVRTLAITALVVAGWLCGFGEGTAHAQMKRGDGILFIKKLPVEARTYYLLEDLGWKYSGTEVLFLDVWRSNGEYVAYSDTVFAPLGDTEVEALGPAPIPWAYYFPPGLVVLVGFVVLVIAARLRLRVYLVIPLAIGHAVMAVLFYAHDLRDTASVPILLMLFYVLATWRALWTPPRTAPPAPAPDPVAERPAPPRVELRPPPPNVETDPFRAPPQPPPLAVVRPRAPAGDAPVEVDPGASLPKLLK